MMYCGLFEKYINNAECNLCDTRAGYEVGSWRSHCYRDEHHPILSEVGWWLKPKSFKFKLFIVARWITDRFPLSKRWSVWFDRAGLHVGVWRTNLIWTDPIRSSASKANVHGQGEGARLGSSEATPKPTKVNDNV